MRNSTLKITFELLCFIHMELYVQIFNRYKLLRRQHDPFQQPKEERLVTSYQFHLTCEIQLIHFSVIFMSSERSITNILSFFFFTKKLLAKSVIFLTNTSEN